MKQMYWYRTYRGHEMYELTGWRQVAAPALEDFLDREARVGVKDRERLEAAIRHGVEEAERKGGRNTFRMRVDLGEGHSPVLVGMFELKVTTVGRPKGHQQVCP